ncbi:E3 ubiquitin-protein ligase hecd-1, partial [Acropora cervicornis]
QDETRQKENFKEDDECLLQKRDYPDEENKQEKQSKNLEAAKEEQEKIKQLQRENKQLKEKVTEKTFGFEKILAREQQMKKKLKDSLEKCQAQTKDKDVLLKKMRLENKRLNEQSNAEKSKCDALSEEVRRLKEITGHERDSAARENQTWKKEIQKWKTKSKECELEKQVLQESLASATEIQETLELLSSDLETANKEQQEQIRHFQRVNAEQQDKVTNENERDSAARESQTWEKEIQKWKTKSEEYERENQVLQERLERAMEQLSTERASVLKENRTLKQKIEVLRKEMTTAKAETSLQAQVVELENKLKKCQMQMSEQKERFRKETNTETDRLEKEVSRLKSRLMETIRPGRVHYYEKDFDTNGVVCAIAKHYGGPNSIQTRIIATRSSNQVGEASDILENRVDREIVSGTKAEEKSWWCVDLTENYALYLTHYTLRHGHNTSFSYLLNWQLQGSHDGQSWETLRTHDNDRGLRGKDSCCTCTWAIGGKKPSEIVGDRWKKAFRYFRIFQTGKNSSDYHRRIFACVAFIAHTTLRVLSCVALSISQQANVTDL